MLASCDLGALAALLPARLVDLVGTELTSGQTFTDTATFGAAVVTANGPSNTTLTYVVDRFEKPKTGSGDSWTTPSFLSLLVYGDVPGGTFAATLELGLEKYTNRGCQNLISCE